MWKNNRRLLLVITLVFASTTFGQSNISISPKFSLDIYGDHIVSTKGISDASIEIENNTTIGFEISSNTKSSLNYGVGIMYLFPRGTEFNQSGNFNFLPLYILGQLEILNIDEDTNVRLIGNLGYNVMFNGDKAYKSNLSLSGGIYIAAGLRIFIDRYFVEGLYKSYEGTIKIGNDSDQLNVAGIVYTTLSVGFGISLK